MLYIGSLKILWDNYTKNMTTVQSKTVRTKAGFPYNDINRRMQSFLKMF